MCATRFCLLIKISKNPDGTERNVTDGQARFAHSNGKGASAKISPTALKDGLGIRKRGFYDIRKFRVDTR